MVIIRKGRHYKIDMLNEQLATLEIVETKHHQVIPIDELLAEYQLGTLTLPSLRSNLDQSWLNDEQIAELKRFNTYLNYLDAQVSPGSERSLKSAIEICGDLLNEPLRFRPSVSTLRRWRAKWLNNNRQSLYLLKTKKNDPRLTQSSRMTHDMRSLIDDIIDSQFLKLNGPTVARCYDILVQSHRNIGLDCTVVSRATFYREIKKLDEIDVIKHRQGSAAANKHKRSANQQYEVNGLFERVEMDAVHANIYLVDLNGDIVGKPIIFLVMDVFSRNILGMHISIQEGETNNAAVSALRHAILPKPVEDYLFLDNKWTCYGCPMEIYVDSGTSFINESFDSLLAQLKITRIAGQTRQPWKRSFIERFNRTLRNKLKGLPGYMGKPSDGFDYDKPAKHFATLTLEEFENIVCILINDEYHQESHAGLSNKKPSEVWDKNIRYSPAILPANVQVFDHYLREQKNGKIQDLRGIQYMHQYYNSDELKGLFKQLKKVNRHNEKVTFLLDKFDASDIVVINPLNNSTLIIPNTRKSSHGLSFQQLKHITSETAPNSTQKKLDEISKQAELRKSKAKKDIQKSNKKDVQAMSFESPLDQQQIQNMLVKRQKLSHSEVLFTEQNDSKSKDEPTQTSTPKIINYKTS
jgi:putative transposase